MKKAVVVVLIAIASIAAVAWAISSYLEREGPIQSLRLAKEKLEKELENLRDKGIPVEFVDIDKEKGCLVVAFKDMEPQYVKPIREIVGYDIPILFRELELKRVSVGEPPASLLKICEAHNLLVEGLDYWVDSSIDAERGLLRIRLRDLTDEEIHKIRGIVGHDVPIEFVEREWMDKLFVGKPSLELLEELENALRRLYQARYQARDELVLDAISGSGVDEENGLLKIYLWDLGDRYAESIEAIRRVAGYDIPLVFQLTHQKRFEVPTSATAALEYYVNTLNLSGIDYELLWQTENEAEAQLYFLKGGDRIPFQKLGFQRTNGSWMPSHMSKERVPSPSRRLEIVGYIVRISVSDGQRCVSSINPLVKNLGEEAAYVWSVQVKIENSTHSYHQSYGTVGKAPRDGLLGPGEIGTLGPVMPMFGWRPVGSEQWVKVVLDSVREKTYSITITIEDAEGTILAENSFIHTFARHAG